MDKNEMLKELISKYVLENWPQELLNMNERYSRDREKIEKDLELTFESVCRKASHNQRQGLKGAAQYICISFLRTSIMENTAFYRIDIYDDRWYLDTEECYGMWDADFIFSSLFREMDLLMSQKKQYGRMVTDMDMDTVKLSEALKYHTLAVEFIRSMIPRLVEGPGYREMDKTPQICIMMGEYRDFNEVLYGENEVKA
ncbi:MAG: hypothetical protein N2645_20720 [Clostridia bacterium]|nr:hypothetical protein [Clostridia bacterium]